MSKKRRLTRGEGWSLESDAETAPIPAPSLPPEKQRLRLRVEKRTKGKTVTVIDGFELAPSDLNRLLKELKNLCAGGGKALKGTIELQGEHIEAARAALTEKGFVL